MSFVKRFREMWKQCSLTDRIIAFFTARTCSGEYLSVYLSWEANLTLCGKTNALGSKLHSVRGALQPLAPIGGIIHLVNNGKTPARGIVKGDFVVETVKNGEQPKLDYPLPPRAIYDWHDYAQRHPAGCNH